MNRIKGLAAILGAALLMVVVAACSQPQSATPTPTVAPVDTPAVDGGKLLEACVVTEMGPRENPVLVARGLDPIPSGFDAGNHAACTFARPISAVKLELLRDGKTVLQQVIPMDAPTTDVRFPLSEAPAQPIGADLDTGGYDHRITVATEDGEETEVLFNADAIWVLDPDSSPKDLARRAMIATREAYAEAQTVPYFGPALVAFEPVEWGDASLGCPKPDVMYAQVITLGFRLVFEHEGRRHEYHTNQDGSTLVGCGEATTPEPGSAAQPTGTLGEPAPDEEPSTFDDSANLAANPDVATVIIGQVVEMSGEKTLPLARNSNSVRFGYWDVRVERYLVTVLPYTEITLRLEQMFVRPDGSLVPTRFPITLNSGERAVFFLTQTPGPNRPLLGGNAFTLAGSGPGGLGGNRTIEDGQVNTLLNGQSRWEPLVEFIDRIVWVAKGAGEKQDPAEAEPVSDAPLAQGHPGPSGSPAANTSPVIPHGTPRVNLTYEGAVYYQIPLSTDDAANLNEDDLELVGATTESNLLLPADSDIRRFIFDLSHDNPELTLSEIKDRVEAKFQIGLDKSTVGRTLQGLNIYKLKDGEEGYVYTLAPGQSFRNEDGTTIRFEADWQRWAAADSNGT